MKLLVVGSGGREHAIVRALGRSAEADEIFVLPGNGGIAAEAKCVPVGAKDIAGIAAFAKEQGIDYAVVAPDDPLVLGAVDALEEAGVPCFGPRANAAIIEGSKAFAKDLMQRYGIPTAKYATFEDAGEAESYIDTLPEGNDIDATRPFDIEIRLFCAGRLLRTEKRKVNQWSGASIELKAAKQSSSQEDPAAK